MGRKKQTKSGCFMIFNKTTRKTYICTSLNTNRAFSQIKYMLRNNKYNNVALQEDWNKYGADDFQYQFLDEGSQEDFYILKKKWITFYKADEAVFGYNSSEYTYNV